MSDDSYNVDMPREQSYGDLRKLYTAEQTFGNVLEVYRNGVIYVTFGKELDPVGRLRFTQDFSRGHLHIHLPYDLRNGTLSTFNDIDHNISNVIPLLSPSFTSDRMAFNNSPETIIHCSK